LIERGAAWLARALCARPRSAWALVALASLAAALLAPRLAIDPDLAALLPHDSPEVELARAAEGEGRSERTLFAIVRGEQLAQRWPALVESWRSVPELARIDATREDFAAVARERSEAVPLVQLRDEDLAALEARLGPDGLRDAAREAKQVLGADPLAGANIVRADPLGLRWVLDEALRHALPAGLDPHSPYLIARDGGAALARLSGRESPFDVGYSRALLAELEARAAELGGFECRFVGGYAVARADAARIRADLQSSLTWSVPVLALVLACFTRSLLLPLALLAPVLLGGLWALGIAAVSFGPLTPLAVSSAAILMGLGVDAAIHYHQVWRAERPLTDATQAIVRTHERLARGLLATTLTSACAFLTFGFGSFHGLRGFGFLLALGLSCALLATLVVLPLVLLRWRAPVLHTAHAERRTPVPLAAHAERRAPVVPLRARSRGLVHAACAGVAVLTVAGLAFAAVRGLRFDADPRHLRPAEESTQHLLAELERELGFSPIAIAVLLPEDAPLQPAADGLERLRESGSIAYAEGAVPSQASSARAARLELFAERTRGFAQRAERELTAAGLRADALRPALAQQEQMLAWPPAARADSLAGAQSLEWRGQRWSRTLVFPTRAPVGAAQRAALHAELEAAFGPQALIADPHALPDAIGPLLARSLRASLLECAALVALVLFALLRRARDAGSAALPLIAALGLTCGWLALTRVPLHPGNFIALPLLAGIGIDNGIHLVLARRHGPQAVAAALRAIAATSATTAVGFGSLLAARTPALASLGAIALFGVLACWAASVLLALSWRMNEAAAAVAPRGGGA
jgi:predicted exporter